MMTKVVCLWISYKLKYYISSFSFVFPTSSLWLIRFPKKTFPSISYLLQCSLSFSSCLSSSQPSLFIPLFRKPHTHPSSEHSPSLSSSPWSFPSCSSSWIPSVQAVRIKHTFRHGMKAPRMDHKFTNRIIQCDFPPLNGAAPSCPPLLCVRLSFSSASIFSLCEISWNGW